MTKRYKKFWITYEDKGKRKGFFRLRERIPRIWVDQDELKEYTKKFPKGVIVQEFNEDCEKGHTYRQLMGLEALDCDCEPD